MPIFIYQNTTGWIPLKLSYRTLTAAVTNTNEIHILKYFLFFPFTDYLLWNMLYKAELCSPIHYWYFLIFFLVIWSTWWTCIWNSTLICFLWFDEIITLPKRIAHWNLLPGVKELSFRTQYQPRSKEGKSVPLQAWSSRKLRFPDFMTTAQDGGKVVSYTHRSPLPPRNAAGTHFC